MLTARWNLKEAVSKPLAFETIATREKLKLSIETLQTPISDTEFNAKIWTTLVDKVIVKEYDELIFEFKNGIKNPRNALMTKASDWRYLLLQESP